MQNILQFQTSPRMPTSLNFLHLEIKRLEKKIQGREHVKECKQIKLSTQESIYFISPINIIRCESQGNYCMIYIKNKSSILISKTLKYCVDLLPPQMFVRTHQSHFINASYIHRISKKDGFHIELENGTIIPVSRAGKANVINHLHNH